MEYGNYGYRDEMTGAGWSKGGAKTEAEVQTAHWHLNDPGVVPNLLQTGARLPHAASSSTKATCCRRCSTTR